MKSTTSFEHIAELWDVKTGDTGSKMISAVKVTAKHIIAELGPLRGKRIYEIACGNGFIARKLAKQAKEVRASDISKSLIEIAKTKYDSKNISYEVRDAIDFKGIPENHFDSVIIHQGIFYIENLDALAKGIYKILKPSGSVIFSNMHPLMYVADLDINPKLELKEVLDKYKLYLKNRKITVKKNWWVGKELKPAEYLQFKRPFSYYVNTFAKHGLVTTKIVEPTTVTMLKLKIYNSVIPSALIIKCTKI